MAANFLPEHDDLFKIFNDSGSEQEFEGYDPEDLEEDFVQQQFYSLWIGKVCYFHHERPFFGSSVLWCAETVVV